MVKQIFNEECSIYNNLKIIKEVDPKISSKGHKIKRVEAECLVCGKVKEYTWSKIKQGRTKSCGCTSPGRRKDITGERFGKLIAIKSLNKSKGGSILWEFNCDCGGTKEITVSQWTSKHFTSCGCNQYLGAPLDLSGVKYGRLTGIESIGKNKAGQYIWKWLCDCGSTHEAVGTCVVEGKTKSCGCYAKEVAGKSSLKHGMCNSREYGAWKNAVRRCTNSKDPGWDDYGGRGIFVCERWSGDSTSGFINFYEDMGEAPEGASLDRIDVNGPYSKENCRWATYFIQNYNTRRHKTNTSGRTGVSENKDGTWQSYINFEGKRYSLGEFKTFEEAKVARETAEIKFYGVNKE